MTSSRRGPACSTSCRRMAELILAQYNVTYAPAGERAQPARRRCQRNRTARVRALMARQVTASAPHGPGQVVVRRVRPLPSLPLAGAVRHVAAIMFMTKIRSEMVDFGVYRTAAARALHAEPLYRVDDGHYQFKYLPAFALAMAPFASLDREAAKGDLVRAVGRPADRVRPLVGQGLPERRRSEPVLVVADGPVHGEVLRARADARSDQHPARLPARRRRSWPCRSISRWSPAR